MCAGKIAQEVCTLVLISLPVFLSASSLSQENSLVDMTFWMPYTHKEWVEPKLEVDLHPNTMIERSYSFIRSKSTEACP